MKRGFVLFTAAMTVVTTSVIMWNAEPAASVEYAYVRNARPVEVPYLDITVSQFTERINAKTTRTESNDVDGSQQAVGEDPAESGADSDAVINEGENGPDNFPDNGALPELVEPEADNPGEPEEDNGSGVSDDPVLTYVGNWTISFYCPCEACCGEWATGCTASGVAATEWHTVATDQFEFGTELYIEGLGYFTVEDRGVSGEWLDVFVADHQQALDLGLQHREVYVKGGNGW